MHHFQAMWPDFGVLLLDNGIQINQRGNATRATIIFITNELWTFSRFHWSEEKEIVHSRAGRSACWVSDFSYVIKYFTY